MTLTSAAITADLTSLQSDESRHDNALRNQSLETSRYSEATFELTSPIELPETLADGASASIVVEGDLTLHGVTKAVEITLDVQQVDDALVIVGSLEIALADYDIAQPSAPSALSVNDTAMLEPQVFFARAA